MTLTLQVEDVQLTIRPIATEDYDLVRTSWAHSIENSPLLKVVPKKIYQREQRWLIDRCLAHEDGLAAVETEHPEHVLGWIVGNRKLSALHYGFVKSSFRARGIGRFLFAGLLGESPEVVQYTQWRESIGRMHPQWVFNPYLLTRVPPRTERLP